MDYHDKFVPPQPVIFRDAPDVFMCKRTITSLLQENALLKGRLERQLDRLVAIMKEEGEQRKIGAGLL